MDTNVDDTILGIKVTGTVLGIANNLIWAVIGFSTSGFWLGLLIWMIGSLITGLLLGLALGVAGVTCPGTFATVGRASRSTANYVGGMFGSIRARFA